MKFIVSSETLFRSVQNVGKVINGKNTIAILDSLLFSIENGMLTITGSDSETIMQTTLPLVDCEGEGRFCINARTIQDTLKEIAEQPITFDIDTDTLCVNAQYMNGHFSLIASNAEDYPEFNISKNGMTQTALPADKLFEGITLSLLGTATEELRRVMTGIYIEVLPNELSFVATDGQKLVKDSYQYDNAGIEAAFILPKKPATILKNILAKEDADIQVAFDNSTAIFELEHTVISCKLTEGRYHNYRSVIPQQSPYELTVNRMDIIGALKRVLVFTNQGSSLVKMVINSEGLTLSAQDLDYNSSAEEKIPCQYDNTPLCMGFNGNFLLDLVSNMGSEQISIGLTDPSRAGIFYPLETAEGQSLILLLMPMMINE